MKVFKTQEGSEVWVSLGNGERKCNSIDVKYLVIDAPDKSAALDAVWADAPDKIGDIYKKEMRVDGYEDDRSLSISVVYGEYDGGGSGGGGGGDKNEAVMGFECSSGSMHITNALSQRIVYGDQDAAGLIGWHGIKAPNQVDGVDIVVGTMRETYSKRMKVSSLNNAYRKKIQELTGTVNASMFKGWKPGEVLFLGASYSASASDTEVDVTFQFAIQPNENSYRIGNVVLAKRGFEYVTSITENSVVNGVPKAKIDTVHLNQVYRYKSFDGLGLGD